MKRIIVLLMGLLLVCSCGHRAEQSGEKTYVFTDSYNREVVVPQKPERVVSLSPSVTEIVFALNGEEQLVGRTDFCTYPAEAEKIPSVGGISNLNVESVLAQKPDLIIASSMLSEKVVAKFDELGVPIVCITEKPRFENIYDNISAIGRLLDRDSAVERLVKRLKEEVEGLPPITERHSCYYVVGYGAAGNFTAGGHTFIDDILSLSGGDNVAKDVSGWSYSVEALMEKDPEYVIIRREDSSTLVRMLPYKNLTAVREGKVIGIESGMIDQQVPRNVEAIRYLRRRIFN